jgi:hypothetical protein
VSVAWDNQRTSPINVYGPPPTEAHHDDHTAGLGTLMSSAILISALMPESYYLHTFTQGGVATSALRFVLVRELR